MKRHFFSLACALTLTLAATAIGQDQTPLASNFLYNYYTQPGASQVTAGMYPAPNWAPANVGHTYYTYQPLMPHEHMYEHTRNYYQYYGSPSGFYSDNCGHAYPGGYGLNKTSVVWQNGASHVGPSPFSWTRLHRLCYAAASAHYCLGSGAGCGYGGLGAHGFSLHGHHGGACASGDCGDAGCASGSCQ
jgi:hypothetical protein